MASKRPTSDGFRQKPAALKALKQLMNSGSVDNVAPKVLHESRTVFSELSLKKFRDTLNRLKRERQAKLLSLSDGEIIPRSTELDVQNDDTECHSQSKLTNYHGSSEETDVIEASCDRFVQRDYLMAIWKEKSTKRQYLSVEILLPSEATEFKGNVKTTVVNHDTLYVRFQTPSAFRKPEYLHAQWIYGTNGLPKIEEYHLRIAAFQEVIDGRKKSQGCFIENLAKYKLPFPVRPRLSEKYFLGWESSAEIVLYCSMESLSEPDPDEDEEDEPKVIVMPQISNISSTVSMSRTGNSSITHN